MSHSRFSTALALAALLSTTALAAPAQRRDDSAGDAARPPVTHYSVKDIGGLGGDTVIPAALDDEGRVVGFSTRASGDFFHAFATGPDGVDLIDLCPDHPWICAATAINDKGQVVGYFDAAEWADLTGFTVNADGSGFARLALAPGAASVTPYGLNARGQVVGMSLDPDFLAVAYATAPHGRRPTVLGALAEGGVSVARAINAGGVVVGESDTADGHRRAFVQADLEGGPRDLGSLDGNNSAATAISDSGLVVGWSEVDIVQHRHAVVTRVEGGGLQDLGTLGGTYSAAAGVNRRGAVVGQSSLKGDRDYHAFVADPKQRRMFDLNTLSDLPSGVVLITARAINARGQIACSGFDGHAYLLTPVR